MEPEAYSLERLADRCIERKAITRKQEKIENSENEKVVNRVIDKKVPKKNKQRQECV